MDETYGTVFTDGQTSWFAIPHVGVYVSSVKSGTVTEARMTLEQGYDQVSRGHMKEVNPGV
jgi:hypothetical protein